MRTHCSGAPNCLQLAIMPRISPAQRLLGIFILSILLQPGFAGAASSPRERILFDDNWRFAQGDPAGAGDELAYTNMAKWIEISGADFSTNPPAAKPEGNPGAEVSYTRPGFPDGDWRL